MDNAARAAISSMVFFLVRHAFIEDHDEVMRSEVNYFIDSIDENSSTEVLNFVHQALREELHGHYRKDSIQDILEGFQRYLGDSYDDTFIYGMISRVLVEFEVEEMEEENE